MHLRASRYTGVVIARQTARATAAAAVAVMLAGCASMGGPLPTMTTTRVSPEVTGAIPVKATGAQTVDSSDWEAVRRTIAGMAPAGGTTVEWSNPDTGSTGAVTAGAVATTAPGISCRSFSTTVSDPKGVHRYRGQACHGTDGRWILKALAADDAQLS